MIRGLHALFYSPQAETLREFFRDKLQFPYVDTGEGWLIFDAPAADFGCHPSTKRFHEISFYCDDLESTMTTLRRRGVTFTTGVSDEGWGFVTKFSLPDGDEVQLYQPKYSKLRKTRRPRSPGVGGRRKRTRARGVR